jgi:hypothetical protein
MGSHQPLYHRGLGIVQPNKLATSVLLIYHDGFHHAAAMLSAISSELPDRSTCHWPDDG